MRFDSNAFKNENIFQEFYELIKKYKLLNKFENVDLNTINELLKEIEEQLEKTLFKKENYWDSDFYITLNRTLTKYYSIFRIQGFLINITYASFIKYLNFLNFLATNSINVESIQEQNNNFNELIPLNEFSFETNEELEFEIAPPEEYRSIEKFEKVIGNYMGIMIDSKNTITYQTNKKNTFLTIFCDNYKAKRIKWDNGKLKFVVISELYYLNVELLFYKKKKIENPEEFALSLYLIFSSFKFIKNTHIEVLDLKKGSIRSIFRIWLEDKTAKKEAINLLEGSKDGATQKSGKGNYAKKKKSALKLGNEEETSKPEEYQVLLDREKLKNEKLRLQNLSLALELAKKATDLLKQGLLTPESLELFVNNRLYFSKEGNNVMGFDSNILDIPD